MVGLKGETELAKTHEEASQPLLQVTITRSHSPSLQWALGSYREGDRMGDSTLKVLEET